VHKLLVGFTINPNSKTTGLDIELLNYKAFSVLEKPCFTAQ